MRPHQSYVKMGLLGAKARWNKEPPFAERFWRRVNKVGDADCWLWQGSVVPITGYGKYKIRGKTSSAHRIAFELTYGPIPKGLCICHHCDVKLCCNPKHLFSGTHKDNMQDAVKKDRMSFDRPWARGSPPGEKAWMAKLTNDDVYKIRELKQQGNLTQKQIGKQFGVGQDQISRIINFKRWSHLK